MTTFFNFNITLRRHLTDSQKSGLNGLWSSCLLQTVCNSVIELLHNCMDMPSACVTALKH